MRSRSGPSAERLGADASRSARQAARPRTNVSSDAILDRYRRAAPEAARSAMGGAVRPAPSSRIAGADRSRSASSGSRGALSSSAERGASASPTRAERARESAAQRASESTRRAEAGTRGLRETTGSNPSVGEAYERAGRSVAEATDVAVSVGISVGLGCFYSGWNCSPGWYCGSWYGPWGYCYPWGFGFTYWWNWGCYPYSYYCHPFGWSYWYWYGYWPYDFCYWYPAAYGYYYAPPLYYSTVVEQYYEPAPEQQVVEEAPAAQGEGAVAAPGRAAGPDSAARASGQYLTLGDQAFRDGRYSDAVHFYAKAVEFAPNEGVLYLVLSDGLFATGDYHYGAYALRKALELDPTLATNAIDKHTFYADPAEFDRQLAVLESYLADHPGDDDARLMLAANYLFGGQPAKAVALLETPAGESAAREPAGALILSAARSAPAPTPR
jgi:cytochrome c-type biogenesis protein CcmH/NrfG